MGEISSTNLVLSGKIPVIAHSAFCPVLDTYNQIFLHPWSGGLPKIAFGKIYKLDRDLEIALKSLTDVFFAFRDGRIRLFTCSRIRWATRRIYGRTFLKNSSGPYNHTFHSFRPPNTPPTKNAPRFLFLRILYTP